MDRETGPPPLRAPKARNSAFDEERELRLLIARLPRKIRIWVKWLRQPSSRWVRIPAGLLFILGGLLGFLPVLGLWMLPLGLALLAEDIPAARRLRSRLLAAYARYRSNRNGGA